MESPPAPPELEHPLPPPPRMDGESAARLLQRWYRGVARRRRFMVIINRARRRRKYLEERRRIAQRVYTTEAWSQFFSPWYFERRWCKDGVQSIGSWRDCYGWGVAAWWWLSCEQLLLVPWQLFKNLSGDQHFFRTIVALLYVFHSPEFDVRVLIALLGSWCLTFLMYVNMDTIVTIVTSTVFNASQKVYLWFYHSWSDMLINQILTVNLDRFVFLDRAPQKTR